MANKQPQEMVILRGIPASGKSFFARNWVDEDPDWRVRINRDDTRKMVVNKFHGLSRHQEGTITQLAEAHAHRALRSQLSVIIDNTSLRASDVKDWYKIANEYDIPVRVVDIDTPIEECIKRDSERGKKVGETVIRDFAKRYIRKGKFPPVPENNRDRPEGKAYTPNPSLPKAIWLDLDGSIAERVHDAAPKPIRGPFDESRVGEDAVVEHVRDVVQILHESGYKIVIMTGRTDACKAESEEWLHRHGVPYDDIFMRKSGDQRKDSIAKEEMFWENVAPKYDIRFAMDDRQQVVDHTREVLKIPVFQLAPGDF